MSTFGDLLVDPADTTPCLVGAAIGALSDADRKAYEAAVAAGVTRERIAIAFTKYGFPMAVSSVSRHLRGTCRCPK